VSAAAAEVRPAERRPLQVAAMLALVAACAIGTVRCSGDQMLLAGLAGAAAVAALVPALLFNRHTLPLALVAGAVPALLSMRGHPFPRYDVPACGLLLVACAETTARSWYVHSLAPRGRAGSWSGATAVVLGAGALAAVAVMAAARARLDGAVLLTALGSGALVVAGVVAYRTARR
jgi:hypothetical protein